MTTEIIDGYEYEVKFISNDELLMLNSLHNYKSCLLCACDLCCFDTNPGICMAVSCDYKDDSGGLGRKVYTKVNS